MELLQSNYYDSNRTVKTLQRRTMYLYIVVLKMTYSPDDFFLQCSVTCGIGKVRRFVRCNVPNESACALIAKPLEEERCILHPCPDDERRENEIQNNNGGGGSAHHTNSIQSNKIYVWWTDHWSSVSRRYTCTP